MPHLHVHAHRDAGGYRWVDDCPPPHNGRILVQPPAPAARLSVNLPPCKPQGGVNTAWASHKCAALRESASHAALPTPQTQAEIPKAQLQPPNAKVDTGTVGQASSGNHAPKGGSWAFEVGIALSLALAFVVVRRIVSELLFEADVKGVERDDAV